VEKVNVYVEEEKVNVCVEEEKAKFDALEMVIVGAVRVIVGVMRVTVGGGGWMVTVNADGNRILDLDSCFLAFQPDLAHRILYLYRDHPRNALVGDRDDSHHHDHVEEKSGGRVVRVGPDH